MWIVRAFFPHHIFEKQDRYLSERNPKSEVGKNVLLRSSKFLSVFSLLFLSTHHTRLMNYCGCPLLMANSLLVAWTWLHQLKDILTRITYYGYRKCNALFSPAPRNEYVTTKAISPKECQICKLLIWITCLTSRFPNGNIRD